jgi:hypothetical protein
MCLTKFIQAKNGVQIIKKKKIAQFSQKPLVFLKTVRFYQKPFGFPFAKKKHDK